MEAVEEQSRQDFWTTLRQMFGMVYSETPPESVEESEENED